MTTLRKLEDRLVVKGREELKMTDFPSLGKICGSKSYNRVMEYGKLMSCYRYVKFHVMPGLWGMESLEDR